jgi:tRNA A-37 threonylcarbamoyl transferase component Bud32/membrane-associated phospholipid phosphatase
MAVDAKELTPPPDDPRVPSEGKAPSKKRRRPSGEAPPLPRQLRASGKYWLALSFFALVSWIVIFFVDEVSLQATRVDLAILRGISEIRTGVMTDLMRWIHALGSEWAIGALRWGTLLVLLFFKRFRHLFVFLGAVLGVGFVCTIVAQNIVRARPVGIDILGHWEGAAHPSRPVAAVAATLIGIAYALVPPGRLRWWAKWASGFSIGALALSRLYLAVDHPTDVIVGIIVGVSIPLIAFRMLTPNDAFPVSYKRKRAAHLDVEGPRGDAILTAVEEQLGITITDVRQFNLEGSGGSTPLKLTVAGEPPAELFAKLYARNHLRADRWYKIGRTLLYGRLEDESSFSTVRRLVQYEDYMLRVMRDAGMDVAQPFGFVEITPEREYLLVTGFVPGAHEILDGEVTDDIIDQSLRTVRQLWDGGIAHRDIKPSNILVRQGKVYLIDVAFGEIRPSPWRQAVDLANMMLVLAFKAEPERVYERALQFFTPDEIAEAFAATHGMTMPSQSRSLLRKDRRDLIGRFRELAPKRPPVSIQRWSFRRAALTGGIVLFTLITAGVALSNFQGAGLLPPPQATLAAYSAVLQPPECVGSDQLLLEAQAVPTAELVPCIAGIPAGWSYQGMDVRDGAATIFLDSDRAGFRAVEVNFTRTCDLTDTTEVASDEQGTRQFDRIFEVGENIVATRYYTFEGGCATIQFRLAGESAAELIHEASLAIGFFQRSEGEEVIEQDLGVDF